MFIRLNDFYHYLGDIDGLKQAENCEFSRFVRSCWIDCILSQAARVKILSAIVLKETYIHFMFNANL